MIQATDLGLSDSQLANARGIIAAVKARGWELKAAVIAIETALTESGMRMIASANVPASQKYPHELLAWEPDGLGHDHASMGMFQQQTGYEWTTAGYGTGMTQTTMNSPDGWGTPAELMDAEKSTMKFLDALGNVDWQNLTNWAAAQAVQRSAFPDGSNYRGQDAAAQRIVGVLWNDDAGVTPLDASIHQLSDTTEDDDMGAPITVTQTKHPSTGNLRYWLSGPGGIKEITKNEAAGAVAFFGVKLVGPVSEAAIAEIRPAAQAVLK